MWPHSANVFWNRVYLFAWVGCFLWSGSHTQRRATAKTSTQWAGDATLAGETVGAAFTAEEQVLCWGCRGLDQFCRLWPCRQVKGLRSFLLRKRRKGCERKQMWIDAPPLLPPLWGGGSVFPDSTALLCSRLIIRSMSWPTPPPWSPLLFPPHSSIFRSCATVIFLTVARRLCSH